MDIGAWRAASPEDHKELDKTERLTLLLATSKRNHAKGVLSGLLLPMPLSRS